jgi:hypothetical protein
MIGSLNSYSTYRHAVELLRKQSTTLDDFSYYLKNDNQLKSLRTAARNELQAIYDRLSDDLMLPKLPVYLPVRKKIFVMGVTFHTGGVPEQIRIYSMKGCSNKAYEHWAPRDVRPYTESEIFETFIHESAHVLEGVRHGRMGHGAPFIKAYKNIEEYFFNMGYESLIDPKLRFMGVPKKAVKVKR